jgi:hypothetical protein
MGCVRLCVCGCVARVRCPLRGPRRTSASFPSFQHALLRTLLVARWPLLPCVRWCCPRSADIVQLLKCSERQTCVHRKLVSCAHIPRPPSTPVRTCVHPCARSILSTQGCSEADLNSPSWWMMSTFASHRVMTESTGAVPVPAMLHTTPIHCF